MKTTVTVTVGEAWKPVELQAEYISDWCPRGMTAAERRDFWSGCEIAIYSPKTGKRKPALEMCLTSYDWKSIAEQLQS